MLSKKNIHRCFWCTAMKFTKKIKVPIMATNGSPNKTIETNENKLENEFQTK